MYRDWGFSGFGRKVGGLSTQKTGRALIFGRAVSVCRFDEVTQACRTRCLRTHGPEQLMNNHERRRRPAIVDVAISRRHAVYAKLMPRNIYSDDDDAEAGPAAAPRDDIQCRYAMM